MKEHILGDRYYAVINLGLRSIRIILFNQNSEIVKKNWYPIRTTIHGDLVEQDPHEWAQYCMKLLHEVLEDPTHKKNLRSISVTSSACCLVVLDKDGSPLTHSYLVSDKRAIEQAKEIVDNPKFAGLFKNSNHLPSPSYMMPKILWLKQKDPKTFAKAAFFLSSNDYLIYLLTSRVVTDPLNAEKMYYDTQTKAYPKNLLKYIGITPKQLPKVVPFGTSAGSLTAELRKELDISSSVKVIVSTYDAICAFLGSGALSEGEACNVSGTVSSLRVYTKKNFPVNGGVLSQKFEDFTIVGGSNNIDGGLLEWAKSMFYGDSYPEKYVYKIMEDEAQASAIGSKGIFFLPYIIGERLPFVDHAARGVFFGLERFHKRNDMIRSIFEASGFMMYDIMSHIKKGGYDINTLRMSGGLAQNRFICKLRANIIGKPVLVIDEVEITSLGSLFIMLKADNMLTTIDKAGSLVKISERFEPDKKMHDHYMKLYSFFKELYHSNKEMMGKRKILLDKIKLGEKHTLENL